MGKVEIKIGRAVHTPSSNIEIYQNNWVAPPRLLRRNIFGAKLKCPTSPPGRG